MANETTIVEGADDDIELSEVGEELYERLVIKVDKGQEPLRIDKFLIQRMEGGTRNKVQQAIAAGFVTVNNLPVKSNQKVKPGDDIVLFSENNPDNNDVQPEPMSLDIVFEDDDILVINKPAGLVVHPGSGNYNGTLLNGIAHYLRQQNPSLDETVLPRFGMVHRIDKNTSGLLLLAKNAKSLQHLAKQFFNHTISRKYIALVWGDVVAESGTITANVGRNPRQRRIFMAFPDGEEGKHAVTHYSVLERFHYVTMVECVLETGRTHQIRVHMKHIGHTLFSDERYGGDRILKGTVYTKYKQFVDNCFDLCPRQALHAKTLGFIHPTTGQELFFESPMPSDIVAVIEKWRRYYKSRGKIEDE